MNSILIATDEGNRVIIVLLFLINRRPSRCLCSSRRWTDTATRESIYCFPSHVIKITPKRYSKASKMKSCRASVKLRCSCKREDKSRDITYNTLFTSTRKHSPLVCHTEFLSVYFLSWVNCNTISFRFDRWLSLTA